MFNKLTGKKKGTGTAFRCVPAQKSTDFNQYRIMADSIALCKFACHIYSSAHFGTTKSHSGKDKLLRPTGTTGIKLTATHN